MDRIDGALSRWPVRERTPLDLDETAEAIASRAHWGVGGVGGVGGTGGADLGPDASLLRAPLPATILERHRTGGGWWTALAGIAAVAAVATGIFVGTTRNTANETSGVEVRAPATPSVRRSPPQAVADDRGIDPSELPRVGIGDRRTAPSGAARAAGGASKVASGPVGAAADVPKAVADDSRPSDALQPAAAVAAGSVLAGVDSVPLRPSMGAIQSALGAAVRTARACLAAGDPPSQATVTFRSDGSVADVTVTGDAAGTPAGNCIRASLSRGARVPPFAEPTFAAPVTVRPN